MMPYLTIPLSAVMLDRRHGLWCDECLLPSLVEQDFNIVDADLATWFRRTASFCMDCERSTCRDR